MTVRQSVFVVPPLVAIAQSRGMFADAGVEVETITVASSNEQRRDLDSARTDVGITATDNLLTWNSTGSTIELIAQLETTTDLALTLRPDLRSLDPATPIRLAVDAPTNGFAVVAYSMMARLGCSPEKYEVVEIGGVRERFDALIAGRADVTLLAPPLDEAGVKQGMTVAMRIHELDPLYPGLGIVCSRASLRDKSDEISKYLTALARAHHWMRRAAPTDLEKELLTSRFGPGAVAATRETIPETLAPSERGIRALVALRSDLGMTVRGGSDPLGLINLSPLQDALGR